MPACRIQKPSNRILDFLKSAFARMAEHDVVALSTMYWASQY